MIRYEDARCFRQEAGLPLTGHVQLGQLLREAALGNAGIPSSPIGSLLSEP